MIYITIDEFKGVRAYTKFNEKWIGDEFLVVLKMDEDMAIYSLSLDGTWDEVHVGKN